MSAAVFANMQARFRQELERQAREAELARERTGRRGSEARRARDRAGPLHAATEVRREKQAAEEAARLEKLASDTRVEETRRRRVSGPPEAGCSWTRSGSFSLRKVEAEAQVLLSKQAATERARLQAAGRGREGRSGAARDAACGRGASYRGAGGAGAGGRGQACARRARGEEIVELETAKQQLGADQLELDRAARLRDIDNTITPEVIQLAVANRLPSWPPRSSRRWARCTSPPSMARTRSATSPPPSRA